MERRSADKGTHCVTRLMQRARALAIPSNEKIDSKTSVIR